MATIDLSSAFTLSMVTRMFRLSDNNPSSNSQAAAGVGLLHSGLGYSGAALGTLYLMKGAIPATATTTANINARASDILVTFSSGSVNTAGDFITSQVNVNPAVISTQYVNGTAAGTASWFWWVVPPTLGSGNRDTASTPFHQIIGTVGVTGSGADLEMGSTSIVIGSPYRVLNLRVQFPSTWTF